MHLNVFIYETVTQPTVVLGLHLYVCYGLNIVKVHTQTSY